MTIKRYFCIWAVLFWAGCSWAQTNPVIRLAIVAESPEAGGVADLITAEFSQNTRVQLLERNDIAKVIREQGLLAGNGDYLKLGRLLGADGLLLLGVRQNGMTNSLGVQLIAVNPGVLQFSEHFDWSERDPARYVAPIAKLTSPYIPKLGGVAKQAIPISVT